MHKRILNDKISVKVLDMSLYFFGFQFKEISGLLLGSRGGGLVGGLDLQLFVEVEDRVFNLLVTFVEPTFAKC